jgi:hypothetical protein
MHANVSHPPLHLHNSLENLLLLQRRCSVSQRYKPHNPRAKRNGCARHPATHQAHSKSWLPTPAWAEKACSRQHACVQSAIINVMQCMVCRGDAHGARGGRAAHVCEQLNAMLTLSSPGEHGDCQEAAHQEQSQGAYSSVCVCPTRRPLHQHDLTEIVSVNQPYCTMLAH